MLTRWEVEGQLRNLHPQQQRARRALRAGGRARHRLRVTVGIVFGIGLAATLELARMRAASMPQVATFQDTEWGEAHVGSYHTPPRAPLFPTPKHPRWGSYGTRGHARDPITGEARQRRLARE